MSHPEANWDLSPILQLIYLSHPFTFMIIRGLPLITLILGCVLKSLQMSYSGPFFSVALGELWQHLLLIYFNIVIIKGCFQHWSLSGSSWMLELSWDWEGYSKIYSHAWSWPSFLSATTTASSYQEFRHLGNTYHQLWLCLSAEHQCFNHRVHLGSSRCSPALCRPGTRSVCPDAWTAWSEMLCWRPVSVGTMVSNFMLFGQSTFVHLRFLRPDISLKPRWIRRDIGNRTAQTRLMRDSCGG